MMEPHPAASTVETKDPRPMATNSTPMVLTNSDLTLSTGSPPSLATNAAAMLPMIPGTHGPDAGLFFLQNFHLYYHIDYAHW